MDYGKVVFMIDGTEVNEAKALNDGLFSKYFYGRDGKIDKIEMFHRNELYKVIYPGSKLPFDNLFQNHFKQYPGITIQINTDERNMDGGRVYLTHTFSSPKDRLYLVECYEDDHGNLLKEIELVDGGRTLAEFWYCYSRDGELMKIVEYDGKGNFVGEMELD